MAFCQLNTNLEKKLQGVVGLQIADRDEVAGAAFVVDSLNNVSCISLLAAAAAVLVLEPEKTLATGLY